MTPFARAAGRSVKPKRVKWVRHKSALALLRAFFRGMGAKPEDCMDPSGNRVTSKRGMLGSIQEAGMWAFCLTRTKVPVVHYWAARCVEPLELAFMLGHELGHVSGKRLESQRNAWREELRADEYGSCVAAVLKELGRQGRGGR